MSRKLAHSGAYLREGVTKSSPVLLLHFGSGGARISEHAEGITVSGNEKEIAIGLAVTEHGRRRAFHVSFDQEAAREVAAGLIAAANFIDGGSGVQ